MMGSVIESPIFWRASPAWMARVEIPGWGVADMLSLLRGQREVRARTEAEPSTPERLKAIKQVGTPRFFLAYCRRGCWWLFSRWKAASGRKSQSEASFYLGPG